MEWIIDRLFVLHACFWWNRTIVSTEYAPACEVSDTGTREVELEDKCKEPSKSLSAPRAVKYVTPRDLLELSLSCQHKTQCHAANKSLSPWKSTSSKIAAWPRRTEELQLLMSMWRNPWPLPFNLLIVTAAPKMPNQQVGFKAIYQDSLNQCSGNNRKRSMQPTEKQKTFGCATAARVQSSCRLTPFQPVLAIGAHMEGHSRGDRTQIPSLSPSDCQFPRALTLWNPSFPFSSFSMVIPDGLFSPVMRILKERRVQRASVTVLSRFKSASLSCIHFFCLAYFDLYVCEHLMGRLYLSICSPDRKSNLPWSSPSLCG